MDLDQLRQTRVQLYSAPKTSTSTFTPDLSASTHNIDMSSSTAMPDLLETTPAVNVQMPVQVATNVGAGTSGINEAQLISDLLGIMTEVRDLLVQLPANIAAALVTAAVPTAAVTEPSAAVPTAAMAAPPAAVAQHLPKDAPPLNEIPAVNISEEEDLFADTNATADDTSAGQCGVCHMFKQGPPLAFTGCGHYPFCNACVEEVKKLAGPSKCPYCKAQGESIKLHFEE